MKIDGICKGIANWINKSKRAQKVLKGMNKNPALYGSVLSFAFAGLLRPTIIGCLPFKDQQDKKYSQASAVAAGFMELVTSAALFIPANKMIEKASKELYKTKGSFFEGNNKALRQFKSVTNRSLKLLALVPISLCRFTLIKPVVKLLFDKKQEPARVEQISISTTNDEGKLDKWA